MYPKKLRPREEETGTFTYTQNVSFREGKTADGFNTEQRGLPTPDKLETARSEKLQIPKESSFWKCYEKALIKLFTICAWAGLFVRLIIEMQGMIKKHIYNFTIEAFSIKISFEIRNYEYS